MPFVYLLRIFNYFIHFYFYFFSFCPLNMYFYIVVGFLSVEEVVQMRNTILFAGAKITNWKAILVLPQQIT